MSSSSVYSWDYSSFIPSRLKFQEEHSTYSSSKGNVYQFVVNATSEISFSVLPHSLRLHWMLSANQRAACCQAPIRGWAGVTHPFPPPLHPHNPLPPLQARPPQLFLLTNPSILRTCQQNAEVCMQLHTYISLLLRPCMQVHQSSMSICLSNSQELCFACFGSDRSPSYHDLGLLSVSQHDNML